MSESFFSYARLADPLLRGFRRSVFAISSLQKGNSVLDVACGTGAQVFEYARRGLNATGLDASTDMLRQAEYYLAREPDLKPTFIQGDAAHLPFKDATFDAASISLALHENDAAAEDAIVREMKRVVKPGGTLVFADFRAPVPRTPLGYAIKFVEEAAGMENRRTFTAYEASGGLTGILRRGGLEILRQQMALSSTVRLVAASNPGG